ncbi:MAG: hypothetical protein ACI4EI_11140 [Muricoprocola sp.]
MSTSENIRNAVQVLYKTYASISKLMDQCRAESDDHGYLLMSDKFLRWRSDNNSDAWLLNSMILVFQRRDDPECDSKNGWKDAPVYTMEVCLGLKDDSNYEPELVLSKFEYTNITEWPEGCSPADHWGFHQPIHPGKKFPFTMTEKGSFKIFTPTSAKKAKGYWNLKRAVSLSFPLVDVTSSNMEEMIFGSFDKLLEQ